MAEPNTVAMFYQGQLVDVPENQTQQAAAAGYRVPTAEEVIAWDKSAQGPQTGAGESFVIGAAREILDIPSGLAGLGAAVTGLPMDVVPSGDELLVKGSARLRSALHGGTVGAHEEELKGRLESMDEEHPIASGVGRGVGAVAAGMATGGESLAAGIGSKVGSKVAGTMAVAGLESGVSGAGTTMSMAYLEDRPLAREELIQDSLMYGAIGAATGGLIEGAGAAYRGVRRAESKVSARVADAAEVDANLKAVNAESLADVSDVAGKGLDVDEGERLVRDEIMPLHNLGVDGRPLYGAEGNVLPGREGVATLHGRTDKETAMNINRLANSLDEQLKPAVALERELGEIDAAIAGTGAARGAKGAEKQLEKAAALRAQAAELPGAEQLRADRLERAAHADIERRALGDPRYHEYTKQKKVYDGRVKELNAEQKKLKSHAGTKQRNKLKAAQAKVNTLDARLKDHKGQRLYSKAQEYKRLVQQNTRALASHRGKLPDAPPEDVAALEALRGKHKNLTDAYGAVKKQMNSPSTPHGKEYKDLMKARDKAAREVAPLEMGTPDMVELDNITASIDARRMMLEAEPGHPAGTLAKEFEDISARSAAAKKAAKAKPTIEEKTYESLMASADGLELRAKTTSDAMGKGDTAAELSALKKRRAKTKELLDSYAEEHREIRATRKKISLAEKLSRRKLAKGQGAPDWEARQGGFLASTAITSTLATVAGGGVGFVGNLARIAITEAWSRAGATQIAKRMAKRRLEGEMTQAAAQSLMGRTAARKFVAKHFGNATPFIVGSMSAKQLNDWYDEAGPQLDAAATPGEEQLAAVGQATAPFGDDALATEVAMGMSQAVGYLQSKRPGTEPVMPAAPNGPRRKPSAAELQSFRRTYAATMNPWVLFREVSMGVLNPETVEAVATIYPTFYANAQMGMMRELNSSQGIPPARARVVMDVMLGNTGMVYTARSPGFQMRQMQAYEQAQQQAAQGMAAGTGGGTPGRPKGSPTMGQQLQTGSQRASQSIGNS